MKVTRNRLAIGTRIRHIECPPFDLASFHSKYQFTRYSQKSLAISLVIDEALKRNFDITTRDRTQITPAHQLSMPTNSEITPLRTCSSKVGSRHQIRKKRYLCRISEELYLRSSVLSVFALVTDMGKG